MADDVQIVGGVLEDGVLSKVVIEQEDHSTREVSVSGGLTVEKDVDGERIAIKDQDGVIKGYVGWSDYEGSFVLWQGTPGQFAGGAEEYANAYLKIDPELIALEGPNSDDTNHNVQVWATGLSVGHNNGDGIDGSDVVADATDATSAVARLNELLAVLRNLGVIAVS